MDKDQPKKFHKSIAVIYVYGTWCVISYFIWKPLVIPFLLLLSGYGATYLKKNLIYGGYPRSMVSGCIWGALLSFESYYLVNLTHAPPWWGIANYLFGLLAAGYIGYRGAVEPAILKDSRLESYYVIAQVSSVISYTLLLLLFILYLHV